MGIHAPGLGVGFAFEVDLGDFSENSFGVPQKPRLRMTFKGGRRTIVSAPKRGIGCAQPREGKGVDLVVRHARAILTRLLTPIPM